MQTGDEVEYQSPGNRSYLNRGTIVSFDGEHIRVRGNKGRYALVHRDYARVIPRRIARRRGVHPGESWD